jgi:PAS domain S-box-containing protein
MLKTGELRMTTAQHCDAKVLIVDDQQANLRLLEQILKQCGYARGSGLRDSRQVLAACDEVEPALILLDLIMPHPDGVAVLEQLRPRRADTFLPVVVLTADVGAEAKRRALAAGATDFITKPFDAVEVLLRIKNLLQTRFLYQQLQQRADRRIEERAALLDQANDAILVRGLDDRILYWNQGAERLYGWTAAEALGQSAPTMQRTRPAKELELAKRTVATEGKWEGELHQVTKDGHELVVASRWSLLRDNEGRPQSYLMINTDVTEQKKLGAQLIQAQRLETVGRLAGGVAHDFNNLLTIILGYSELAILDLPQQGALRELIQQVHNAGRRAAGLTQQLLAYCRKQAQAPVVLDLNSVVQDTEKMLRRLIGEDIALDIVLDPMLGRVRADRGQMEQVLMNLAVNARDAMPHGGKLTIETRTVELGQTNAVAMSPGAAVMLAVSDIGCGMDEATKVMIFEPFFTTKEVGKGTGLGLAVVDGIVKASGGLIEVESSPGAGTTFKIYLPQFSCAPATKSGSHPGTVQVPSGTGTVLLVEDEDEVRSLAAVTLRSTGYTVLEAPDGEEAVRLCRTGPKPIDLLVTDLVMPKMSGQEVATRAAVFCPSLKVLYMSGYTEGAVVRHGPREAGVPFLQKPFTPVALVRTVHEVLGH